MSEIIPLVVDFDIGDGDSIPFDIGTTTEVGGGHSGSCFPNVTAADDRKIMQVNNGQWTKQYPEIGDESVHILTNLEILALLTSADGG